jgi:putative membrane protein
MLMPLAAASLPLCAQSLPNPGGMAPDTPRMETGKPPPDHANTQDKLFVRQATLGGSAEVEMGKMARQKGNSQAVRDFGSRMERDHADANQRLAQTGKKAEASMPRGMDPEHQRMHERLAGLSGRDFDITYLQTQVAMHQQTANLLMWEISFGQSSALTKYAADALPAVMEHLEAAKQALAALTSTPARS